MLALGMLMTVIYVAWDYHRVSQLFYPPMTATMPIEKTR